MAPIAYGLALSDFSSNEANHQAFAGIENDRYRSLNISAGNTWVPLDEPGEVLSQLAGEVERGRFVVQQQLLRGMLQKCVVLFETFYAKIVGSDECGGHLDTRSHGEVDPVDGERVRHGGRFEVDVNAPVEVRPMLAIDDPVVVSFAIQQHLVHPCNGHVICVDRERFPCIVYRHVVSDGPQHCSFVSGCLTRHAIAGWQLFEEDNFAGASVLGLLLGMPIALVMQRRWSPQTLLTAQLIACALCWSALAGTLTLGRDLPVWILLAAAAGVSMSGSAGLVRATLVNAVPVQHLPRASTIDALAQDAVILLGPVAVAVGVLNGPVGAPVAVVAVSLVAVNVFRPGAPAANSLSVSPSAPSMPASSPVWSKRLLWSLLSLAIGMTLGAAEAGAVGLVTDWGLPVTSVWQVFLVLVAASAVGAFLDIKVLQRIRVRQRLAIFLASMTSGCFFVATDSSTVIVVHNSLGRTQVDFAITLACYGFGSMLLALALPRVLDRYPDRRVMLTGCAILPVGLLAVAFLVMGSDSPFAWPGVLTIWFILGAATALILTPSARILRRYSDDTNRPAVFAAQFSLSHACFIITYPLAGILGATLGLAPTALILAVLAVLAGILAAWSWKKEAPPDRLQETLVSPASTLR